MALIKEILAYLITEKKLWLIPLFAIFIILAAVIVASQGSVVAPFIYTLF